jgi:hypothetical protein
VFTRRQTYRGFEDVQVALGNWVHGHVMLKLNVPEGASGSSGFWTNCQVVELPQPRATPPFDCQ